MKPEYPARYIDEHGEEETIIRNDGKTLRMRVRGVEFSGMRFEDFEPDEGGESKEAYLQIDSKDDIFRIWPTLTEYVQ